jgi:DNA replication protein DnaC
MDTPQVLLEHYLKQLRLPTMVREYPKLAEQCAKEAATFEQFLLRLVELEMMDRERRATERRIKAAKFPVTKSLETYNFREFRVRSGLRAQGWAQVRSSEGCKIVNSIGRFSESNHRGSWNEWN